MAMMSDGQLEPKDIDPFGDNHTTTIQRDALFVLAAHHPDGANGKTILTTLEDHYGSRVDSGKFYPNLNRLAERGIVNRTVNATDKRTNQYVIPDSTVKQVANHLEWVDSLDIDSAIGEVDQ